MRPYRFVDDYLGNRASIVVSVYLSSVGVGGIEPRPSSYKDAAPTSELHAEQVRPVGIEPTLGGLKVRCATATPQPQKWAMAMRFKNLIKR